MTDKHDSNLKDDAKYSICYDMSFGIDVTQKEIDEVREGLIELNKSDYIWDLKIDKNSTDEEIAKFIGISNVHVAEGTDLDNVELYRY